MIRRARGYAPAPLPLPAGFERAPPLLALGGELKSTFCLLKDGQAILSQHMGDLEDAATFEDYQKALSLYLALFDHAPKFWRSTCIRNISRPSWGGSSPAIAKFAFEEVQHHHAHIASCLAENGVPLDTPPGPRHRSRRSRLRPRRHAVGRRIPAGRLPRFERLALSRRSPCQVAPRPSASPGATPTLSSMRRSVGSRCGARRRLDSVRFLDAKPLATLDAMMRGVAQQPAFQFVRTALRCGGRGIRGICREAVSYRGPGRDRARGLVDETALAAAGDTAYRIASPGTDGAHRADCGRPCSRISSTACPAAVMAARFHRGLARAVVEMARLLFETEGDKLAPTVALSGGSFQNRLLLEHVSGGLARPWPDRAHACPQCRPTTAGCRSAKRRSQRPEASSLNNRLTKQEGDSHVPRHSRTDCCDLGYGERTRHRRCIGVRREINLICVIDEDHPIESLRRRLGAGPCRLRHEPHRRGRGGRDAENSEASSARSQPELAAMRHVWGGVTDCNGIEPAKEAMCDVRRSRSQGLYPFLHGKKQDPVAMNAALIESVRQKARHHQEVFDAFFAKNGQAVVDAAGNRSRSLSTRRPALFHGQWRIELRCRSCRRRVSASDHGGPAGADGGRPDLRPHHDHGRRQRCRLRPRVRAADHRPGPTGRWPDRHFDQRQLGQSGEGLSQGEGEWD